MKKMYTWWSKYMFWENKNGFPFGAPVDVETDKKLVIGHRGSSEHYPENTFLSFDKAIEEGAKGIECDIRMSSDGEYVIMHDSTVNRTTDFEGDVSDFTLGELTAMDAGKWKGSEFEDREDTKIPSLESFLERYKGEDIFLELHFKIGPSGTLPVIDNLKEKDMLHQCFIFADRIRLDGYNRYEPKAFVINDGFHSDSEGLLDQAITEKWDAFSPGASNITKSLTYRAEKYGVLTQVSTISSDFKDETSKYIDLGVNIFLGDDCKKMVEEFNEQGISQLTPYRSEYYPVEYSDASYFGSSPDSGSLSDAFDFSNDTTLQFFSGSDVSAGVTFKDKKQIRKLEMYGRDGTSTVKSFKVEATNEDVENAEEWVVLFEGELERNGTIQPFEFANVRRFKSYRVYAIDNHGGNSTRIHNIILNEFVRAN